ncbi:MAG: phosphate/phosphite/phosphonate ABC transporter substrate-binding protein [Alphaproteobacteria bacterium]|uniref:phosphate/phosphite/phosphonate ABC transporter substrate-binding protein n=1 Tax=Brevundimonas sp. TaxID=1871086 RepID=UPI0017EF7B5F|nr:phosphate/phosphite/phosphonate ABC transporter substrate-binding protein [Brevundimonas sp.]MBA3049287.1 phosphate/phosphite/phosphonate ABC transporter substrate-binding protein [Brevundimonas sp.]MBU3975195.1 phosphate/phosphite/phosphonate ABC transporter substrate-binding protein [Alphaproteobacteria bacterium]MBU4039105.1 phosphate/phosphite/phosphonate ABC transporter substrate-binding protein [Alphaproteobacteria bacterium]MBU4136641.1 phosphate/phosphite/phosphonate ABC transporter 
MTLPLFTRRLALAAALVLGVASCGGGDDTKAGGAPTEITFSILSAEGQASAGPLWQPLLDDMSKAIGVPVKPYFGSNYTVLVEAMRGNQTQVAWFSAKPAVEAIDRADAEVIARTVNKEGLDSYRSTLIVRAGSGITLEQVLACGKRFDFGIGDAQSTSGTLAPMAFLFNPRNIVPAQCFKTVRSANHQSNAFSVASGVLDVATSNTVNTVFMTKQNPQVAAQIQEIWQSPPIPESGILVREDLDPALKEKIRSFFLTYGQGDSVEAQRQREVLSGLEYSRFNAADDGYLNPIREMIADQQLNEARAKGDAAAAATAERELQRLRSLREVQP